MKLLRVLWLSFLGLTFVAAQAPTPANCQTVLTIVGVQCAMPCCAKALPMSRQCPMQHLAPAQDIIAAHATFWNDTLNALHVLHTLIVRTPELRPSVFAQSRAHALGFLFLERAIPVRAPPANIVLLSA